MILSIAILVILILNFSIGRHRGLLLMILRLISFVVSYFVANLVAQIIGAKLAAVLPIFKGVTNGAGSALTSSNVDDFFYNGIAFFIVFFVVMRLIRWAIMRFNIVTKLPVIHQVNALLGGIINFALAYVIIFLLLTVFQVYPSDWWQAQIKDSGVAQWMINQTPILSQQVVYWLSNR